MNYNSGPVRGKSTYTRLKSWHAKRATNANEDSPETSQLRDCLITNGSGTACLNASTGTVLPSTSTVLPPTSPVLLPNDATNTGSSTNAGLSPNITSNVGASTSSSITNNNATTTTAHPQPVATNSRLGWKIGLVVPLLVIIFIIGLALRHKIVKTRNTREKWQEVSTPHELGGEKRQTSERESQREAKEIQLKGTRENNPQTQEIISTPEQARKKEPSHAAILDLERGRQQRIVKQGDDEDNRSRKSSIATRFSLRSFSLRPPMDMSVFQARTDAPLDTIQLEIQNRERMSKMKPPAMPHFLPLKTNK